MQLRKRNLLAILTMLSLLAFPARGGFAMQDSEQHAVDPGENGQDAGDHAEDQESHADEEVDELDPVHHNADATYIDFAPFGELQLPRIFLVKRGDGSTGVDVFASTDSAIERGGYIARMEEGVHSVLDAKLEPAAGHVLIDFSLTKHLIFAWIGALLVGIIFIRLARMYKRGIGKETAPQGIFQNLFESLVVYVRDDIAVPVLGAKSDKYLPYLLTAFFFILTCNLLGMIPYGATATSNLMVTAVLASFTFGITQIGGTKDYWRHIFWPPDAPVFVKIILMPVEILGLFTKPFALAVRLFANMTAGHLVILSLIGLIFAFTNLFGPAVGYGVVPISLGFALFISLLELLIALIQAYVFTMLSALFIGMAVEEHHHEPDSEPGEAAHGPLVEATVPVESPTS
ncbi:MAG: ATP synthase F0 subunit A [Bacteroidetes bacterium]|nr:MAG: ATP synthase F0 subunit A [Bacteroidota bacterium]